MLPINPHIKKLTQFDNIPLGQFRQFYFNIYSFWGKDKEFYIHPNYRNVHTINWLFNEIRLK